jgi:hypothetical protein
MHRETFICLGNVRLEDPPRGSTVHIPKDADVVSEVVNGVEIVVHIVPTDV